MKHKRTAHRTTAQTQPAAKTYRIVDEDGNEVNSFTLTAEHPKVTLHIDLFKPNPFESPAKRLEREVWARFEDAFDALEDLEKIAPEKALDVFEALFTDTDE